MAQETNTDRSPLLPSFPDLVLTLIHHPHCLYLLLFPPPMLPYKGAHLLPFPLPASTRLVDLPLKTNPIFPSSLSPNDLC